MPEIMLNCKLNGRRHLVRPLERLLDEAYLVTDDDGDYNNMDGMKEFLLLFPFLHIINKSEDAGM